MTPDPSERKATPVFSGVLQYFPNAIAAVARLSKIGNDKHNLGGPLRWRREKSSDHGDSLIRHQMEFDKIDPDTGEYHAIAVAWRALAQAELLEESKAMSKFMSPSEKLLDFLRSIESLRLVAYNPTPNDVWTIGYGHTRGVKAGDICLLGQADEWLRKDLTPVVQAINRSVTAPLTQNQFDALCSLVFNIGVTAFEESHLLVLLNDRKYAAAADEFLKWDHQNGVELPGLKRRRKLERDMFLA